MDLEKKDSETGVLMFYILIQGPLTKSHIVDVSTSASFSEASIELKPKPFDFKSNRDILPEKTGSRLTRYLQCKSSNFPLSPWQI